MAMSYKLTALILVLAFFIAISTLTTTALASPSQYNIDATQYRSSYGPGSLNIHQCPSECSRRCKQTRYKKPCLFYCNKCCNKCLCVPPGYYGNKASCSCYNEWKTKEGGPKCP